MLDKVVQLGRRYKRNVAVFGADLNCCLGVAELGCSGMGAFAWGCRDAQGNRIRDWFKCEGFVDVLLMFCLGKTNVMTQARICRKGRLVLSVILIRMHLRSPRVKWLQPWKL